MIPCLGDKFSIIPLISKYVNNIQNKLALNSKILLVNPLNFPTIKKGTAF